jgi:tRNA (guanine-N7-)-methyltransferase
VRPRRRLPLEQLEPYLFATAPGQPLPPLDWPALFGNANPVEIEVGFGKGLFLLTASAARPDVNYFGVEIVRALQLFVATRVALRGLPNVKLASADARALLRDAVPEASVSAVHVYFPDPWWKLRHHKRRLFTPPFAAAVARVLKPGGVFHIVTDVGDYFEVMKEVLATTPGLTPVPPLPPNEPQHDLDYLTNYERKFRKEGRPIYRVAYAKNPT